MVALMIQGLDHTQLSMPRGEEDRGRAFYSGLLGLQETPKPPELAKRGGVWFLLPDGRGLHLGVEEPFQPALKAHPAFRAAALETLARQLEAAGYPVKWDDSVPGVRRFHSADPFGNRLEFQEAEPQAAGT
jgi:catechol 2,3-dioxygenase-like lactoylglutathione lyase family enzyme